LKRFNWSRIFCLEVEVVKSARRALSRSGDDVQRFGFDFDLFGLRHAGEMLGKLV